MSTPRLENMPGRGEPNLIYGLETIVTRLDLEKMFPLSQPLEVELGAGDGSFLAEYAAIHRDRNFIGVERLLGRIRKVNKKGWRAGLTNLRLVRIEAGYFMRHLLPLESAQALHIYFPDPWPKRRHHKHRLINEPFTELARVGLAMGGMVYLRTDEPGYFGQMKAVFGSNPGFKEVETPADLTGLLTDFEKEFRARGLEIHRQAYQRVR